MTSKATATKITATELARGLSDVLNRVRYKGEHFIIERNGETIAELTPTEPQKAATLADLFALLREKGFPDEDFANDLEAIHASQGAGRAPTGLVERPHPPALPRNEVEPPRWGVSTRSLMFDTVATCR
jgi:antitoxin (DNA-binding transcriptional repressor) of toxin-antitoxin stability system